MRSAIGRTIRAGTSGPPTNERTVPYVPHESVVADMLGEDPAFAAEYLNQVLADADPAEVLLALRRIAQAFGGVPELARRTNLNAKSLYRTLSERGNPELRSLVALLGAVGLRLAVAPLRATPPAGTASTAVRRSPRSPRARPGSRTST